MHFEGYVEKIIEAALKQGIAKTKAEALRLGLLELNQKYGLVVTDMEQRELEMDLAEFDRMEKRIAQGKTKLHKVKSIDEIFT
jgi:hypothetical protein